jgi:hypothetical protein
VVNCLAIWDLPGGIDPLISTKLLLPNQSSIVQSYNTLNEFDFPKRKYTINESSELNPARYSKRTYKAAAYHWAGTFIAIARRAGYALNPLHKHP